MKRNQPLNELINYIDTELRDILDDHHRELLYEKVITACTAARDTAIRNVVSEPPQDCEDVSTQSWYNLYPTTTLAVTVIGVGTVLVGLSILLSQVFPL